MSGPVAAISVESIRKAYGATVALDNASFVAEAGSVHALLGENGAGKSTMVKLLSGLLCPDAGRIVLLGKEARLSSPRDAHRLGLQTAFQELTLVPDLTVAQNMLLPYEPVGLAGQLRGRHGEAMVAAHLQRLGLGGISPRSEIRTLDLAVRQKIEIAKAILRAPKILLLDEPTSALSGSDVDWLGGLIAEQRQLGTTIVFISHRMPEVRLFCDTLTILRNGRSVRTAAVNTVSDGEVIELIIGRSLAATFPPRPALDRAAPPLLRLRGVTAGRISGVSLTLRPGEILGVAGLQGMGQLDLFLTLFGDVPVRAGTIEMDGAPVRLRSPRDAIAAAIGINLVPEERKTEALFLRLDGRRNATLPVIDRFTRFSLIDAKAELSAAAAALSRVQVHGRALHTPVKAFSGGNQQKIVLAKWLVAGSRVLLLFDPTRGVDVGTKHEIYGLINDYVRSGGAVLLYSSEIEEIVHLSHRVLVVYRGQIATEIDGAERAITEAEIMRGALGGEPQSHAAQREQAPA